MKRLFFILLGTLLIVGCAQDPYKIDPIATTNAEWEVGEIVHEGEAALENDDIIKTPYTRVFQGVTTKGYFIVQEFFEKASGKTDPYLVVDKMSVTGRFPIAHGTTRSWYAEGGKRTECIMEHGKTVKPCIGWYRNGAKMWEGGKLEGLSHGKGVLWYRSGETAMECDLNLGVGFCTGWYKSGKKEMKGYKGKEGPHGLVTLWYENGQKKEEANYQEGQPHGLVTLWYENGQKTMEGFYENGELVGALKVWDGDGDVIDMTSHDSME